MFTEKNDTLRQILTISALVMTLVVNTAGGIGLINNVAVGDVSDRFITYITPPGYVFSVWSVIYTGLIAYAIYQALPAQKHQSALRGIALPFILNAVFNTVWIFVWLYEFYTISLFMMAGVLVTLLVIYMRLGIGRNPTSTAQLWCVHIPFSIYLGWITLATVVNTTVFALNLGWEGAPLSGPAWSAIMLVIASVIGTLMSLRHGDVAYICVFIWAFIGIIFKYSDVPLVMGTTIVMGLFLIATLFIGIPTRKRRYLLASV